MEPSRCCARRGAVVLRGDRLRRWRIRRKLINWAKEKTHLKLEVNKRPRALPRFEPLPRRWVVERSFTWLIKNRCLVRDFEQRTDVAETLIRIAANCTMVRRTG